MDKRVKGLESQVSALTGLVNMMVRKDEVISSINLSTECAKVIASKIELEAKRETNDAK